MNDLDSIGPEKSPFPNPSEVPARRCWTVVLVAGLLAGVVIWSACEFTQRHFVAPRSKIQQAMGGPIDGVLLADQMRTDTKNAILTYGAMGGVLGLALGLAGGLSRKNSNAAMLAGLLGMLLGCAVGFLATKLLVPIYFSVQSRGGADPTLDLTLPFLIHAGIWSLIAAIGGLAYGLGLGLKPPGVVATAVGGLVGGLLGAVIYELAGALVFPLANTNRPIAEAWPPRLLGAVAVALLASAFAASASRERKPKVPRHQPVAD